MSKRKADQLQSEDGPNATPVDATSSVRSKRGSAAAASNSSAADSSAAAAAASTLEEEDTTGTVEKPVRRGGRVAAPTEIRPEQKEAMTRVATTVRSRGWGGELDLAQQEADQPHVGPAYLCSILLTLFLCLCFSPG